MKFRTYKTREEKLKQTLKGLLLNKTVNQDNLDGVIKTINDYEKNNLDTIEKLKKDKLLETKRISGALKQTINAHGPITNNLIGSATKRIYGALLHKPEKRTHINLDIGTFILILIATVLLTVASIVILI